MINNISLVEGRKLLRNEKEVAIAKDNKRQGYTEIQKNNLV